MTRLLSSLLASLACLLVACGGGANSHEAVMQESIDLMSEAADIIESVTDKASAEDAKAKFEDLGKRQEELKKKIEAMEDPTKEQEEKLKAAFESQMQEVMGRMGKSMMALQSKPEVMAILEDGMDKFMGE